MSDYTGIAGVGLSIQQAIAASFARSEPLPGSPTRVLLARGADLLQASMSGTPEPTLAIFVSRILVNPSMRMTRPGLGTQDSRSFLPINVHFLLIPFADTAESEYRILGRAVECLETTPVLSGTMLAQGTGWTADETIQVVAEETPLETIMRIFETLGIPLRLATPYLARGLRLETTAVADSRPGLETMGRAR
jgi:hypothetical protein